jgi:hypothetical protein
MAIGRTLLQKKLINITPIKCSGDQTDNSQENKSYKNTVDKKSSVQSFENLEYSIGT